MRKLIRILIGNRGTLIKSILFLFLIIVYTAHGCKIVSLIEFIRDHALAYMHYVQYNAFVHHTSLILLFIYTYFHAFLRLLLNEQKFILFSVITFPLLPLIRSFVHSPLCLSIYSQLGLLNAKCCSPAAAFACGLMKRRRAVTHIALQNADC
jgi:hypothetical protein